MEATVRQVEGISVKPRGRIIFQNSPKSHPSHEINSVCRGLGVQFDWLDLVGEGMGLAAPVCLFGGKTVFPLGRVDQFQQAGLLRSFYMNGVSVKKFWGLSVESPYRLLRRLTAPRYVKSVVFRPLYYYLMWARTGVGLKAVYSKIRSVGVVTVSYRLREHAVDVEVDADLQSDVYLMVANELSGRIFTQLFLDGNRIVKNVPPWIKIDADSALLYSPLLKLGLEVQKVDGCRLYAGREVVARRLDWAGFSYVVKPGVTRLSYRLEMVNLG